MKKVDHSLNQFMKLWGMLFGVCLSCHGYSQAIIPLERLITLANRPFKQLSDSLTSSNWRNIGMDSTRNTEYTHAYIWVYELSKGGKIVNSLITFKNVKTGTVDRINQYIDAYNYDKIFTLLFKLGFKNEQTTVIGKSGVSRTFSRKGIFLELLSFPDTRENGEVILIRTIDIIKVF